MATVVPFRGILYSPEKVEDMSKVVAPPYDVIYPDEQEALHQRHPWNVIRLILGKTRESDTDTDNRHTRSAAAFNSWRSDHVMLQDETPAMYVTAVDFMAFGKPATRYGLIACVGLEPFEKGVILPHEKTFSKVKSERLGLMKLCKANFSQIFSLYQDHSDIFGLLRTAIADLDPIVDLVDDKNERHRLWRITRPEILSEITGRMEGEKLYIADGHHRYETALNYREWLKETDPSFDSGHPANNIMMYLSSMADPGMVIFPTHRILPEIPEESRNAFEEKAGAIFDVVHLKLDTSDAEKAFAQLGAELAKYSPESAIGVLTRGGEKCMILHLPAEKQDALLRAYPPTLRVLDVTVLTQLILMDVLGLNAEQMDQEGLIRYISYGGKAVDAVLNGADMGFYLNPTRIGQVQDIAESGNVMPRKSTYFYPKVLTGLVLNTLTR